MGSDLEVNTWGHLGWVQGTLGDTWGHLRTLGNTCGGFRGHLETGLGHGVGLGNLLHGIQTFRLTLGDTWDELGYTWGHRAGT